MIEIAYLGHSGFSVRTGECMMIFDYVGDDFSLPEDGTNVYAFVSHSHGDHYGDQVKKWRAENRVTLVGGHDVRGADITLRPGEGFLSGGIRATAYPSTDEGVSFLVSIEETALFHAGDLNFWHWKEESTEEEVREAEEAFNAALQSLAGQKIDVAFFPIDPRLGPDADEGARRFAMALAPRLLIPMHFWEDPSAALAFARGQLPEGVAVRVMTTKGDKLVFQ